MIAQGRPRREVVAFVGLVFLLSVPFWVLGAVSDATVTGSLSVASMMVAVPFTAALILTARSGGLAAVRGLLARVVDPRLPRGARWYLPVFLLMPAVLIVEVGLLRLLGRDTPAFEITPLTLVVELAIFWVAAIGEEVGWTGFMTDRLLATRSLLWTGLVIGAVWAVWHVIAILEIPAGHPWSWVVFQVANQVVVRVLIVWIYVASGRSLFAAIGFHALTNVSFMTLFPVHGSHYDPLVADIILAVAAAVAVLWWRASGGASERSAELPAPAIAG